MKVLLVGLKKRSVSQLGKELLKDGFETLTPTEVSDGSPSVRFDMVVLSPSAVTPEEEDTLREIASLHETLPLLLLVNGEGPPLEHYRSMGYVPQTIPDSAPPDELSAKVRQILPVVPQEGASILQAGDLSYEVATRVVSTGDQRVSLTPKEGSVFAYLLGHANQVVTRTDLLRDVWGYDFDTETNVVDVYIRYLREKLGRVGKKEIVETVRGSGYRLVVLSQTQAATKRKREISIVAWTAVISSILLIAGIAITYAAGHTAVQSSQGPNFEQIALQTAHKTDSAMDGEISMVRQLSIDSAVRELLTTYPAGTPAAAQSSISPQQARMVAGVKNHFEEVMTLRSGVVSDITLVDLDGHLVLSTEDGLPLDLAKSSWFQQGSKLGKGSVGTGDIRYLEGRPMMDLFAKVYENDVPIGEVKATMELQGLLSSITKVAVGQTGHTMLVDSKGVVVVCPIFAPRSHQVDVPLMRDITARTSGWKITDYNPHGGKDSIVGFAAVERKPGQAGASVVTAASTGTSGTPVVGEDAWYILLAQNPDETYDSVQDTVSAAALLGAAVTALFSVMAYLISRRYVRPPMPRRVRRFLKG